MSTYVIGCEIMSTYIYIPMVLKSMVFPFLTTTGSKVFDLSGLSSPHKAVGNGQHLVCAAVSLAAALGCIVLYPESSVPKMLGKLSHVANDSWKLIPVAADGRCFFSCLYIHTNCSEKRKEKLFKVIRNASGFPIQTDQLQEEEWLVLICIHDCFLFIYIYIYNFVKVFLRMHSFFSFLFSCRI